MKRIRPTMRHVLAASAILAVSGGVALAGAAMGPEHGRMRGLQGMFQDMDADQDGVVSRAEIEARNAARADEIDADKNGAITAAELLAWHDAQRQKRMEERLAAMDSDGDGTVSVEEFGDASTWRMARFDRNGDGEIEMREMRRHGERYRGTDGDRHGHRHGHGYGPGYGYGEPSGDDPMPPAEEPQAD